MKKVTILFLLLAVTLLTAKSTFAYTSKTTDFKVNSNNVNMTIIGDSSLGGGWYWFALQYSRSASGYYFLFGTNSAKDFYVTLSSSTTLMTALNNNYFIQTSNDWVLPMGNSGTNLYVFVNSISGAAAQSELQSYINSNWYIYIDPMATDEQTALYNFTTRYYTQNDTEIYIQGRQEGYAEGFRHGKDEGYQIGMEDYGWYDTINEIWRTADYRYNEGYQAGADIDMTQISNNMGSSLQSILDLNFGGITIGALVMIPIMFSVFVWFIRFTKGGGK